MVFGSLPWSDCISLRPQDSAIKNNILCKWLNYMQPVLQLLACTGRLQGQVCRQDRARRGKLSHGWVFSQYPSSCYPRHRNQNGSELSITRALCRLISAGPRSNNCPWRRKQLFPAELLDWGTKVVMTESQPLTTLMSGHYQWSAPGPRSLWSLPGHDCCHRCCSHWLPSPPATRNSVNCQVWNITGGKTHLYNTMHQINPSNDNNQDPYGGRF